jgi:hypothetical protein
MEDEGYHQKAYFSPVNGGQNYRLFQMVQLMADFDDLC